MVSFRLFGSRKSSTSIYLADHRRITSTVWQTVKDPLEAFLNAAKDASDQSRLVSECQRRRTHLESQYVELTEDVDAIRAAGLFPLPRRDEFFELDSVKNLFTVNTVEESLEDDPSLIESAEVIVVELDAVKDATKRDVVERLVAVFSVD